MSNRNKKQPNKQQKKKQQQKKQQAKAQRLAQQTQQADQTQPEQKRAQQPKVQPKVKRKAGFVDRLLGDEKLRSAIWFGAAAFLVFYLGAMLVFRVAMFGGEGSKYDSIIVAVVALVAAVVVGRKKYNDDV